jgi:hypothetical protein
MMWMWSSRVECGVLSRRTKRESVGQAVGAFMKQSQTVKITFI